jgi:DNA-binding NtrC family response regulator
MKVAEQDLPTGFVGRSPRIVQLRGQIEKLGVRRSPVLIQGESGTGKEVAARSLYNVAPRGQFVPIDCGSLVGTMMESELFGHARGAFTGAVDAKRGLIELANGGTAFFDEIGELPLELQVKLLRVLQEQEIRPLGSLQRIKIDVRLVAATNRDLQREVAAGRFREDLFHRLNVLQINLPPLRERMGDVPGLARAFLRRLSSQLNRPGLQLSANAFQTLQSYDWPGNVRELESVIQRAAVLAKSCVIEPLDLELPESDGHSALPVSFERAKQRAINGFEHGYLIQLLSESGGNVSRAAQQAGKDRRSFQRLLRKYNLSAANYHH